MSHYLTVVLTPREAVSPREYAGYLLEPYDEVEVTVPDDLVGTVMSDLSARRGRVLGQDTANGMAVVRAHVPCSELIRYPIDLRSATHGTGSFTRTFASYEPVST